MVEQSKMMLTYVRARLNLSNDEGQALIEYALIISLIALLAVGGLTLAGNRVGAMFSNIADALKNP